MVSGETSGDLHGSHVVEELIKLMPSIEISAWGGDRMKSAGANITTHIGELNVMGFSDVILNLGRILNLIRKCKSQIAQFQPDAILFIDFSDFNLRLAKWAKSQNIPTHWYIAPKLWAWRSGRINNLKSSIDHLYCIFPFEEAYFKEKGMNATYVGNPLVQLTQSTKRNVTKGTIALLPGSRPQEIKLILPIFAELIKRNPGYYWKIAGLKSLNKKSYEKHLGATQGSNFCIVFDKTYDLLSESEFAIVASGTATLEAALLGAPQVVVYKTSRLNYWIAKKFIRSKFISLPNIILQKKLINELVQEEFNIENIEKEIFLLANKENIQRIKQGYIKIQNNLGNIFAAKNVAQGIIKFQSE
jgi:lipid-A-disaccharide synthase